MNVSEKERSPIPYPSEIVLELPVPPLTNTRLKAGMGHLYRNPVATEYQDLVRSECIEKKILPFDGDVDMTILWYRKIRRGDIPDRWKDVCDALQAKKNYGFGTYHDDSQIRKFTVERNDEHGRRDGGILVKVKRYGQDGSSRDLPLRQQDTEQR